MLAQTDQCGRTTHYEYDAARPTHRRRRRPRQRTEYGYDEAGNLVSQTDANGHVTRYEYDGLGRRTATVCRWGSTVPLDHGYDAVGNVVSTTDFNGDTIHLRLRRAQSPDGKTFPTPSSTFTYTPTGQRETVTDARGTTFYTYDERDRLLSRTDPDGTHDQLHVRRRRQPHVGDHPRRHHDATRSIR